MVVLDTSALLYWTLSTDRLSEPARLTIEAASELLVSSISLWEIGIKAGKGKLELPLSLREYCERLARVDLVTILPVDLETWLANLELPWEHKDPADRTIVATASLRGCSLVSSDRAIAAFYSKTVW